MLYLELAQDVIVEQKAFSLFELLVVILIVSILAGGVLISYSPTNYQTQSEIERFAALMNLACDEATWNRHPYGVLFHDTGYQFQRFGEDGWNNFRPDEVFKKRIFADSISMQLKVQGGDIDISTSEQETLRPHKPQVVCDGAGNITDFVVIFSNNHTRYGSVSGNRIDGILAKFNNHPLRGVD